MQINKPSLLLSLLFATVTACHLESSKRPSSKSDSQGPPKDTNGLKDGDTPPKEEAASGNGANQPDENITIGSIEANGNPDGSLFEATYRISVLADVFGGVNICDGQVKLIVNKDFTVTLPTPEVECAGGLCKVDMAAVVSMLRSSQDPGSGIDKVLSGINSDKKFLSIEKFGNFEYTPARPLMLLSPFYFDPIADAISVDEIYNGTVTDKDSGLTATGSFRLKVTEANDSRIRWRMTSEGWTGIPKPRAGILNLMDVTWNLNPIGIPNISVFTLIGDIIAARRIDQQQGDSASLAKLCAGTTGEFLGTLEELSAGLGDDSEGGFASTLQQFGEELVSDVAVGISLDLLDQKILGQKQTPD